MTSVTVEITPRPPAATLSTVTRSAGTEPAKPVIVDDVESLAAGAVPGCGDDNPYN
jgi:hypothetical protein